MEIAYLTENVMESKDENKKEVKSVFGAISVARPRENMNPKENFLTELFAWILKNVNGLVQEYVNFLCEKVSEDECYNDKFEIDTQLSIKTGSTTSYIDMLIKAEKEDNCIGFICEHKVDSELSEDQIKKYMDNAHKLGNGKYYSVLLTKYRSQHSQPSNVSILWRDIYDVVYKIINNYDKNGKDYFILEQFLLYLKEEQLYDIPEMICPNELPNELNEYILDGDIGFVPKVFQPKIDNLKKMFDDIATVDFETECNGIMNISDDMEKYAPICQGYHWGRIGVDCFYRREGKNIYWNMGLFGGVIINPKDHKIKPVDESKGPDFVVLVESEWSSKSSENERRNIYNNNVNKLRDNNTIEYLENNRGDFDLFIPEKENWRLLVLRRPLYDIIKDCKTCEEQMDAIKAEMIHGFNLIIKGLGYNRGV